MRFKKKLTLFFFVLESAAGRKANWHYAESGIRIEGFVELDKGDVVDLCCAQISEVWFVPFMNNNMSHSPAKQ